MNRSRNSYDRGDLPSTKKKEFWNPDGEAFQAQIPTNLPPQPKPECGQLTVENGTLVCHTCKHSHTLPVPDIDAFIRNHPELMKKKV